MINDMLVLPYAAICLGCLIAAIYVSGLQAFFAWLIITAAVIKLSK